MDILYEHPDWFRPLFAALDRRGIRYRKIRAQDDWFDPAADEGAAVLFNRMSPSAGTRGIGNVVSWTAARIAHAEAGGATVVNGSRAWAVETSKGAQLDLLRMLDLPFPAARVIQSPSAAIAAAEGLRFPIVVKPDLGGSGAGIVRFESRSELRAQADAIDLGPSGTALVQEYVRPRDGGITRVEVMDGRYLYAIRVFAPDGEFNLCPADACQRTDGVQLTRTACAPDAPKNSLRVEAYEPPAGIIRAVERIAAAAAIDVGGIEYLIGDDDLVRFYDINALSNFVGDGPQVLGFDTTERLADWLETLLPIPVASDR